MKQVVIWGAAVAGRSAFSMLDESAGGDYRVLRFIDKNPELIGTQFCGKIVHPISSLAEISPDTLVLLAANAGTLAYIEMAGEAGHYGVDPAQVVDAGKLIMFERYGRQFPLAMSKIWNRDRPGYQHENSGREDLIVEALFDAIGVDTPKYCDIGARDAVHGNNTWLFYEKGASGMAIDPLPTYVDEWARLRPRDRFLNIALSDTSAEDVPFYLISGPPGSANADVAETGSSDAGGASWQASARRSSVRTIRVRQETFNDVADRDVQFIDIDTDGVDMQILTSIDFDLFPHLAVISIEQVHKECLDHLRGWGFTHFLSNSLNSLFIRDSIVDQVFADPLCAEIFSWHKIWMLLKSKADYWLPM